ncbi:hypothetical protein [Pantoea agglomerans]|uniref:hypothetical protein n=1 Tax=Enterobacter agglomerans TaxID=549 RepID=UPI00026D252E|nr:hypothetical protein [Pantoea agglomerans]KYN63188.1 hypothetical protein IU46_018820 [Pantoea agglomerans]MBO0636476.1 hypothetical protein [Pantoea agglomerans]
MIISASSNNKLLIESGVFNQIVSYGVDNTLSFNFNGLMVNLRTILFGAHEVYNHNITAGVENGYVIINQPYRLPDNDFTPTMQQGMLVPYEVGKKPDGKRIYISWRSKLQKAGNGTLVLNTSYSFYEDM